MPPETVQAPVATLTLRRQPARTTPTVARALSSPGLRAAPGTRQSRIDQARARSFVYRFLARAFEAPTPAGWQWLCSPVSLLSLLSPLKAGAGSDDGELQRLARAFTVHLHPGEYDRFLQDYVKVFGRTRGTTTVPAGVAIARNPGHLLLRGRLAARDALFESFGLNLSARARRAEEHLGVELEFMSLLAARQAAEAKRGREAGHGGCYDEAERLFLKEHVGGWGCRYCEWLADHPRAGLLAPLARLTAAYLKAEVRRFGLQPISGWKDGGHHC